ncbi:MAG TPA: MBL fold metallo-hydrolase [Verrucomicrobiota bacterium]|nr:MBL fold metallo-hydrolase [Verrucomicrobiota bacterium]
MSILFTVLGSGSAGNSSYLEYGETRLLIDAGLSARQIRQRLAQIGRSPETLTGILITHEHSDHIDGLSVLGAKLKIPVFCNRLTRDGIEDHLQTPLDYRLFATGSAFAVGSIGIESFTVPHDAQDPVGFLLHAGSFDLGFVTDLGHATKLVLERIRSSNLLVFETNHDVKMLQEDPRRPWSLKQRILSRHGHLCNEDAAEAIEQIMSSRLSHLFLGHLSRDCNRPELARRVIMKKLDQIGAHHVQLTVTDQATPTAILEINPSPVPAATVPTASLR